MESWYEKRKRGLKSIIATLHQLDLWNIEHPESPKILIKEKLIRVVAADYELSYVTARKWVNEAMELNANPHEIMLEQESILLGITKSEVPEEVKTEMQDILDNQRESEDENIPSESK